MASEYFKELLKMSKMNDLRIADLQDAESIFKSLAQLETAGKMISERQWLCSLVLAVYQKANSKASRLREMASMTDRLRRLAEAIDLLRAANDPFVKDRWVGSFQKRLQSLTYFLVKDKGLLSFKYLPELKQNRAECLAFATPVKCYLECDSSAVLVDPEKLVTVFNKLCGTSSTVPNTQLLLEYYEAFGAFSLKSFQLEVERLISSAVLKRNVITKGVNQVYSVDFERIQHASAQAVNRDERILQIKNTIGAFLYDALPEQTKEAMIHYTNEELKDFVVNLAGLIR